MIKQFIEKYGWKSILGFICTCLLLLLPEALKMFAGFVIPAQFMPLYALALKGSVLLLGGGLLHKAIKLTALVRTIAGLPGDDNADALAEKDAQQAPPQKSISGRCSLLTLFLFTITMLLALCTIPAHADGTPGTYWNIGNLEFWYPLAHVDATPFWKSVTTGDEMIGAQTRLASFPCQDLTTNILFIKGVKIPAGFFSLNAGGITSLKANGMPYLSGMIKVWKIQNLSGDTLSYIGFGYGHDFKLGQDHLLIGATFPIW